MLYKTTLAKQLERVQRVALFVIIGALCTTSTIALNAIPHSAHVAIRLREARHINDAGEQYSETLSHFDR